MHTRCIAYESAEAVLCFFYILIVEISERLKLHVQHDVPVHTVIAYTTLLLATVALSHIMGPGLATSTYCRSELKPLRVLDTNTHQHEPNISYVPNEKRHTCINRRRRRYRFVVAEGMHDSKIEVVLQQHRLCKCEQTVHTHVCVLITECAYNIFYALSVLTKPLSKLSQSSHLVAVALFSSLTLA